MPPINKSLLLLLLHALITWVCLTAVLCAIPAYLTFKDARRIHWLNTDAKPGTATVTAFNKPELEYSYVAGGYEYTERIKTSENFEVGTKFDVYFSASHPWLSCLRSPPLSAEGGWLLSYAVCVSMVLLIPVVAGVRDELKSSG